MKLHPACELFPMLAAKELHELAADIAANGLHNPIVTFQGQILDGRNRFAACEIAGVERRFVEWGDDGSAYEWAVSQNLIRRHLTSSQRAVIALDLLPILEREAKARQRLSKGRGKKVANKFATFGRATEIAARITKTNSRYVELLRNVKPDLLERVRSGELTVPQASKVAEVESRRAAAKIKTGGNIITGDMRLLWELENDSVDLFLTDPPYDRESVKLYARLSELAAAKLKPGGLCLAYSGQLHLPAVMQAMSEHLQYWWTFAIRYGGPACSIPHRKIQNRWKPILAFAKSPVKPSTWLVDILEGGGREKIHHDWQQNESEAGYLIEHLSPPNGLVVDPFCGSGTIPVACKATGRNWLATEIDKTTAMVARQRLADMG